ncbi:hypothetical protein MPSEU_000011000 [Mayamaea pseudoterrestris]|nr:hypothetical protein MPSEU_000011000 [Mayamaea pseudoterrestris]
MMRRTRQVVLSTLLSLWASECCFVVGFSPAPRLDSSSQQRIATASPRRKQQTSSPTVLQRSFYDDFDDEESLENQDKDEIIDPDSLGDWRLFRRNLAAMTATSSDSSSPLLDTSVPVKTTQRPRSVSKLNEEILKTQSESLHEEYTTGVWAHTIATPEVGGLLVRLPLEAEIFRNHRHSITGAKLHQSLQSKRKNSDAFVSFEQPHTWFHKAQKLLEREMFAIAELGQNSDDGHIDASTLNDERAEVLSLYLDHQETWQEVCLCLQRDEKSGIASTLVLNRPMAFKLTDHLARLCLYGTEESLKGSTTDEVDAKLVKFMSAFRQECAVYVGGPDDHHKPAEIVHGIAGLAGAVEISPGTGIYRGGREAAIDGVLKGLYKPLDFRFFMGKHKFAKSMLDLSIVLGKYQPIACSRSLVLKQCISLPKPLWHEVLDLTGGEMKEISRLEHNKKGSMQYEIVEEDDDEDDDDSDDEEVYEIIFEDGEVKELSAEVFEELFPADEDDTDEF